MGRVICEVCDDTKAICSYTRRAWESCNCGKCERGWNPKTPCPDCNAQLRPVPGWDEYFMSLVHTVKTRSKDPNTQIGCVIVGPNNEIRSTGYNSLPFGVADKPERLQRPEKYRWIEHGDRNAIYLAARNGVSLTGCRMYLPGIPCIDCARGIIQVGIVEVVFDQKAQIAWEKTATRYVEDFRFVEKLFEEAGVRLRGWVAAPIAEAA